MDIVLTMVMAGAVVLILGASLWAGSHSRKGRQNAAASGSDSDADGWGGSSGSDGCGDSGGGDSGGGGVGGV